MIEEGKAYTTGGSFRSRAEAHQRRFRAQALQLGYGKHAHWLKEEDAQRGANFYGRAHAEALARADNGKGVHKERTLANMLSSQAMCFNIFGNLLTEEGLAIATNALRKFLPTIQEVTRIHIEYTPSNTVFGDQSGRGGVDCDVLIEYDVLKGGGGLLAIETKFVEEEFSTCGFREKDRDGIVRCPAGASAGEVGASCLYSLRKAYRYWQRSCECGTLKPEVLSGHQPCPFGDGLWQLWVNHTLAHAEARKRGRQEATFAVCAPRGNDALLKDGKTIADFRGLLTNPASMRLITLDDLIDAMESSIGPDRFWQGWIAYLRQRYLV